MTLIPEKCHLLSGMYMPSSSGLHRTGILAYCARRNGGMTRDESPRTIGMMREETASALAGKYLEATKELMLS